AGDRDALAADLDRSPHPPGLLEVARRLLDGRPGRYRPLVHRRERFPLDVHAYGRVRIRELPSPERLDAAVGEAPDAEPVADVAARHRLGEVRRIVDEPAVTR